MSLENAPEAFTKISPNPTDKVLNVRSELTMQTILVKNLAGQVVLQPQTVNGLQSQMQVGNLPPAMYLLEIHYQGGLVRSQRFSKR
jgi:hypothetical protein